MMRRLDIFRFSIVVIQMGLFFRREDCRSIILPLSSVQKEAYKGMKMCNAREMHVVDFSTFSTSQSEIRIDVGP
jgi:hypothetical protein